MKQIHAPIVGEISPSDMKQFKSEALILRNLTNPNIVSLMKISVRTIVNPARSPDEKPTPVQTICMISEYLELGSLADLLYGPRPVSIDSWNYLLLLDCASQAASGIRYLHTNKPAICHRDLKGSNLVVDSKWTVKVTDFGMSRFIPDQTKQQGVNVSTPSVAPKSSKFFNSFYGSSLDTSSKSSESASPPPTSISASTDNNMISPEMTSNLGTTAWCAPELLVTESAVSYSLKVDVYSFGMVLWEMWERKRPFHDVVSKFEIIERIRNGNRPPLNNACPLFLVDLINRCCHMDPEQRPNFNYIVKVLREELEREKRRSARSLSDTSFTSIGSVLFGPGNEANSARLLTGPRSSDEYNDDFVLSAESPNKTTPYILFPEETISPIHNDSLAAGSLSSDTNSNPRWTKWRDGFVHRSLSSIPNSERVLPASIRNDSARNMQPLPEIPDREIPSDDNTEDIIDDDDYNTYDITE